MSSPEWPSSSSSQYPPSSSSSHEPSSSSSSIHDSIISAPPPSYHEQNPAPRRPIPNNNNTFNDELDLAIGPADSDTTATDTDEENQPLIPLHVRSPLMLPASAFTRIGYHELVLFQGAGLVQTIHPDVDPNDPTDPIQQAMGRGTPRPRPRGRGQRVLQTLKLARDHNPDPNRGQRPGSRKRPAHVIVLPPEQGRLLASGNYALAQPEEGTPTGAARASSPPILGGDGLLWFVFMMLTITTLSRRSDEFFRDDIVGRAIRISAPIVMAGYLLIGILACIPFSRKRVVRQAVFRFLAVLLGFVVVAVGVGLQDLMERSGGNEVHG